jgi:hypothetical protein
MEEQSVKCLTAKQLLPVYIQIKKLIFLVYDIGCGITAVHFVVGTLKKVERDGLELLAGNDSQSSKTCLSLAHLWHAVCRDWTRGCKLWPAGLMRRMKIQTRLRLF